MKSALSPRDWILLSSYLDDELNPREKARVESRLQSTPELREGLASLQRTKEVLRRAPARRVPRNFTLPASMAQDKPNLTLRLVPALRLSSAVVALISVFLMVSMFARTGLLSTSAPAALTAKEAVTMESAAAPAVEGEQQPPSVVYWGGPPQEEVYGMGGAGGDGCPNVGPCGGGAADIPPFGATDGLGGGDGGYVPQPMVMATQPAELFKAQPTPPADLQQPDAVPASEEPVTGTGPILGVAPNEVQGDTLPETNRQVLPLVASGETRGANQLKTITTLGWIGLGLFVIAVGLFVTALLLRRKAQR